MAALSDSTRVSLAAPEGPETTNKRDRARRLPASSYRGPTDHARPGQNNYLRGWLALSLQPRDNDNGLDPYSISGSVALRGARVIGGALVLS
jgi:hypothetical protein